MGVNRSKTDQYQLRLPPGLRDDIKAAADLHSRSMNAEIVARLEAHPELVQLPMHISYLQNERVRLLKELAATRADLDAQKVVTSQLQHLINTSSADAERDHETESVIESKFNALKEQSNYLEKLKAELLELSKERYELDADKDKLIDDQSKLIDRLKESNDQVSSIIRRFKIAFDAAARGDRSLIDHVVESARDHYHYDELLAQDLAQNQNSEPKDKKE